MFDDEKKRIFIPDTIEMDGVKYKVTSISSKAFYKNNSVKSVTIGKNVTKIGSKAFYGCKNLKQVVIHSKKIKASAIGSKAFSKVAKNVRAYVPSKKYASYKKMLKKAGIGSKVKIYKIEE